MGTGISNIANVSTRSAASSLSATAAQSSGEKDRKTIAQNFDAFLGLLTTQLRNQSPLDPLDSNQFTQQLVQFSSVEQQLKTNDLLSAMAKGFGGGAGAAGGKLNAASAASLIGVQVSADASTQKLTARADAPGEHRANYPVKVKPDYTNYAVTIADETGKVVFSGGWNPPGSGDQTYAWDGRSTSGVKVDPTKSYNIQVTGESVANPAIKSVMSTERSGVVSAVDLSGTEEMVSFGPFQIPLSKIKRVASAGS